MSDERNGFGLGEEFAVIVGGAPITAASSAEIEADSYGTDAADGVQKCIDLMEAWPLGNEQSLESQEFIA